MVGTLSSGLCPENSFFSELSAKMLVKTEDTSEQWLNAIKERIHIPI